MDNQNNTQVKISTADPSALGLFGLAMVTLVASSQKFGFTDGLSFVVPWAFFLGGIAQLFACVHDAKHNNHFGTTAFGAFGLFWIAVGTSWLIQMGVFGEILAVNADPRQLGVAFVGYLIFCIYMTIAATETNRILFTIFVLVDILLIALTLSSFGIMKETMIMVGAVTELSIALLSFYGSAANILNNHFGQVVLPAGKPFGIFKKTESVPSKKKVS
jgi:uncharacterized protein